MSNRCLLYIDSFLALFSRISSFNSLSNAKILVFSKQIPFADNKINVAKMITSVLDWVENIVESGENAAYRHFLLFPQCFQKASTLQLLKIKIVWLGVKSLIIETCISLDSTNVTSFSSVNKKTIVHSSQRGRFRTYIKPCLYYGSRH